MKSLSCHEVEADIELFAAGECDEQRTSAIQEHLAHCPSCASSFRQVQAVLGLLDIHAQESDRLDRLRQRLVAEEVRRGDGKARILPFLQRAGSLAAMLLVIIGLFLWLGQGRKTQDHYGPGNELIAVGNKDYALWSKKEIGSSLEARNMEAVPARAQSGTRGKTIVWAAPGAKWQSKRGPRIILTAGELFVRIPSANAGVKEVLQVQVSTMVVKASHGAFFVELRKPRTGAHKGRAEQKIETRLFVTILTGRVELRTPKGTVSGSRGEVLTATANSRPLKQVLGEKQLPRPPG